MSTHSTILTWRIPWTEAPGRLQSIGLQSQTRASNTFAFNRSYNLSASCQMPYLNYLYLGGSPKTK